MLNSSVQLQIPSSLIDRLQELASEDGTEPVDFLERLLDMAAGEIYGGSPPATTNVVGPQRLRPPVASTTLTIPFTAEQQAGEGRGGRLKPFRADGPVIDGELAQSLARIRKMLNPRPPKPLAKNYGMLEIELCDFDQTIGETGFSSFVVSDDGELFCCVLSPGDFEHLVTQGALPVGRLGTQDLD